MSNRKFERHDEFKGRVTNGKIRGLPRCRDPCSKISSWDCNLNDFSDFTLRDRKNHKNEILTFHKGFPDFEIGSKVSETHDFLRTIRLIYIFALYFLKNIFRYVSDALFVFLDAYGHWLIFVWITNSFLEPIESLYGNYFCRSKISRHKILNRNLVMIASAI